MDVEKFLHHIPTVAEAPGGVQRLRELVLDLGLRGRLTARVSTDGDVQQLLDQTRQELQEAWRQRDVQKPPAPSPIKVTPHAIPDEWQWAPLGSLVAILDFRRRPVKSADRLSRIAGKADTDLYPYYGATQQAGLIDDYLFDEELTLLGEDGAPFLTPDKHVAYVVSGRFWVNNHAHVLRGLAVLNRYLAHALNRTDFADYVTGTTRLKLTQGRMIQLPIPVPPLREQERIVGKVDELVHLCDEYDQRLNRQRDVQSRLAQSATAHIAG